MTTEIPGDAIDGGFTPRGRASVAAVEIDGESVLYDEDSGAVHVLNATGSMIWACFDGSGTIDEIVADIVDAFGADAAAVRNDVVELARQLGGLGLLEGVAREEAAAHDRDHAAPEPLPGPGPGEPRFLDEPPST